MGNPFKRREQGAETYLTFNGLKGPAKVLAVYDSGRCKGFGVFEQMDNPEEIAALIEYLSNPEAASPEQRNAACDIMEKLEIEVNIEGEDRKIKVDPAQIHKICRDFCLEGC